MMFFIGKLASDQRGASAVEFALAIPILLTLIIGILQLGILFSANAGLRQAVEEGARYATIYPNPSDSAIVTRVTDSKFGLQSAYITGPTVTHGTSGGVRYVDVAMSYAAPLNFVLFQTSPVTLNYTRRSYQP